VPISKAEPGTTLDVAGPGGHVTATVAALPFLDPTKRVPAS
jgi:hypothetical protein